MHIVKVKHLGLAAYIRMLDGRLVEVTANKEFVFQTEKTLDEWRLQYSNSESMRHDSLVCEMRHHLK